MKKITFLVAAVLASAGMSAQTVQKWAAMNDPDSEQVCPRKLFRNGRQ